MGRRRGAVNYKNEVLIRIVGEILPNGEYEDCFVAAMIASPPYTTEQMIIRAITSIQLTGLYSQALIEWNALPEADKTWDRLKQHFTVAYIAREQSGTGTTSANGYHMAANVVATDDALSKVATTFAKSVTERNNNDEKAFKSLSSQSSDVKE